MAAIDTIRTRLAAAATSRVDVLALGDSVTEGATTTAIDERYVTALARKLQAARNAPGVAGGIGFVNTFSNVTGHTAGHWSFSGAGSGANNGGLFGRHGRNFAINETATFTFSGTSFTVHHARGTAFATAGVFTVSVDGGAAVTVTPAGDPQSDRGVYTSPVLTRGAHTVLLTPPSGGQLYTRGIHANDQDNTTGVHLWEDGLFGTTTGAVNTNIAGYQDGFVVANPGIVLIFLGLNDYSTQVAAATYKSNLQAIIATVKTYVTAPMFMLVPPYARTDVTAPTIPLSAYVTACSDIAAADPTNVAFYDLSASFVPASTPTLMADAVHPNTAGHANLATLFAAFLSGAAAVQIGSASATVSIGNIVAAVTVVT